MRKIIAGNVPPRPATAQRLRTLPLQPWGRPGKEKIAGDHYHLRRKNNVPLDIFVSRAAFAPHTLFQFYAPRKSQ